MLKKALFLFFIIYSNVLSYSIITHNDYYNAGLVRKIGTYDLSIFNRANSSSFYFGAGNLDYLEVGGNVSLHLQPPELFGLILHGDFYFSWVNGRTFEGSTLSQVGDIIVYYGEGYAGFQNPYTSFKVGFQNLVSSDAIYHHLFLDDFSGSFFSIRWDIWMSRFFDFQLVYNIVRPHQSNWSNSYPANNSIKYRGLYGKSLYFKKLNFRPLPWIRIGIMESVFFTGENFNPWYANPMSFYYLTMALHEFIIEKQGAALNLVASSFKLGADFNIGFKGWRIYGEALLDDWDGSFLLLKEEVMPVRSAFVLGGEIRGYLFTEFFKTNDLMSFILGNLYFNFEYAVTSKYVYSREPSHNYEYVREEITSTYNPQNPFSQSEVDYHQRRGNFIGYMYGNNADSIDLAIGWRSDLMSTKEYLADYQNDIYFDSINGDPAVPNKVVKVQLHYRRYRLGDERSVSTPFYINEHFYYDIDPDLDSDLDGNKENDLSYRKSEFLKIVLTEGHIFDINIYTDLFRISSFYFGLESNFYFEWVVNNPYTRYSTTDFEFKFNLAFIVTF